VIALYKVDMSGRASPGGPPVTRPTRPARAHVLVVEDDPSIRALVCQVLRASGHEVREAVDGLAALQQLTSADTRPFLILLDLTMPRMSGPELVERLRADAALARIPIVTMTAGDGRIDAPSHALKKPFDMRELIDVVARFVPAP
jgi:CheY-like chemotaxis protein